MSTEKLYTTYKEQVVPGEKGLEEIITFLKNMVDIDRISFDLLPKSIEQGATYNVVHSSRNERIAAAPEDLIFSVYKIIKNDRSAPYYSSYIHISPNQNLDTIYLIFEENTMCIQGNCDRLLAELLIYQGVSEYDYTNETILLYSYFSILEHMKEYDKID